MPALSDPRRSGVSKESLREMGRRIAEARTEQNLTQDGLADRLALSILDETKTQVSVKKFTISRWERGENFPEPIYRRHLVKVLGKSQAELGLVPAQPTAPEAALGDKAGPSAIEEISSEPTSTNTPGVGFGPIQLLAEPRSSTWWKPVAVLAGAVVCLFAGLAVFQVWPFKETVILDGVPLRPAPAAPPHTQPVVSTGAPDCMGPLSRNVTRPRNGMSIQIEVSTTKPACWTQDLSPVSPGATLRFLIEYYNSSKFLESGVIIGANLAPGQMLVPNTTEILNSRFPHGTPDPSNNIASGGVNIGNYDPRAGGYVEFEAALPLAGGFDCGWNEDRTVGFGQVYGLGKGHKGDVFHNTAVTDTYKPC